MLENEEDQVVVGTSNQGSRKRHLHEKKRDNIKRKKYSDPDPELYNFRCPCNHLEGRFKCKSITKEDLVSAKKRMFEISSKVAQDQKIATLISVSTPQRKRQNYDSNTSKPHKFNVSYKVNTDRADVDVCKAFFIKLYGFSHRRVLTVAQTVRGGATIKESRGGDHKSMKMSEERISVTNFLNNLRGQESHYGRNKSKRIYLSAELNITRLWKKYIELNPAKKVSFWFFNNIFQKDFNIGFGTPAVDICSQCCRLRNEIKTTTDAEKKQSMQIDLAVHKRRAKQYHTLLQEEKENEETFCFDLQQVQALPKLPIGEAFYSRQLAFYAFCVTDRTTRQPVFYTWVETQAARGAVEVSSAVCDFLRKHEFKSTTTALRLFADGCGGQNKNTYVMHALAAWLAHDAPAALNDILVVFPVRGHSYLPADQVFGRVEKTLRMHSVITLPEEYVKLYRETGEVRQLGLDWFLKNYKILSNVFKKTVGIKKMKRIQINKKTRCGKVNLSMKMEMNFRIDDESKKFESILKKGKNIHQSIDIDNVELVRKVKPAKLKDVAALLNNYYGDKWQENQGLGWFRKVMADQEAFVNTVEQYEHENDCDCLDGDDEIE